jgi:Ca2+-binding RTX toxin-like protein
MAASALGVEREGGPPADRLVGTKGADVLRGHRGADVLLGRGGFDRFAGGPGPDRIVARDGGPDEINCGPGRDIAMVDDVEDGVVSCERVSGP